jgi:hypothetical protein
MNIKVQKGFLITSLALLVSLIGTTYADDTDIYMNPCFR